MRAGSFDHTINQLIKMSAPACYWFTFLREHNEIIASGSGDQKAMFELIYISGKYENFYV